MSHTKDKAELWALSRLDEIIQKSRADRDAFPGEVVELLKKAAKILKKRQEHKKRNRYQT